MVLELSKQVINVMKYLWCLMEKNLDIAGYFLTYLYF